MADFTLERRTTVESTQYQELAHDWVMGLTERMLAIQGQREYAEFPLLTDETNAAELLDAMKVGDLLLRPGELIGQAQFAEYETNNPEHDDKMGLYYGDAYTIPNEPDHIFLSATVQQSSTGEWLQYVAVGFEYNAGTAQYRQMVGLVAHPGRHVDALRVAYGQCDGDIIAKAGYARPARYTDVHEFVDCTNEILDLALS